MIVTGAVMAAVSFLIAATATRFLRGYFHKIGFVDEPGPHKIHFTATPLGGGVGILAGFVLPVAAVLAAAQIFAGASSILPDSAARNFEVIAAQTRTIVTILMGAIAIFFVGLADDRYGLTPVQKLFGQVIVAATVASFGVKITFFIHNEPVHYIMTIGWMVVLMNSFNLLDNCNGLSAGVAAVISFVLLLVAVQTGQWLMAAMLAAFIGALVGFLIFNFPAASIFMGDAGSMLVGYVMAVVTILFTFYSPDFAGTHWPVILPVLVMAVPLFDTASVIVIRIREGRPIFQGDNRHLSHRLMAMGMSETWAVVTIWLLTFATGIAATLLYQASTLGCIAIAAQAAAILGLLVILERTGGRR